MITLSAPTSILLCIATISLVFAQLLPDSPALVLNELEHLYLDNPGPGSIKSTITPCTNYVDSSTGLNNNTLGRQTSAQWIRTAFRKTSLIPYMNDGPLHAVKSLQSQIYHIGYNVAVVR